MNPFRIAALVFSVLFIGSAQAQDKVVKTYQPGQQVGGYVGGLIGNMYYELGQNGSDGQKIDKSTFAITPYGGYNFFPWFGLEAGIVFSTNLRADFYPTTRTSSLVIFTVAPKFTWQINKLFSIYGKVGMNISGLYTETQFYFLDETTSWAGVGVNAGVGLQFAMDDHWIWRLGYEFNQVDMSPDDTVKLNVDVEAVEIKDISAQTHIAQFGIHYQF